MWIHRRLILSITILSLAAMILVGQGCGQTEESNDDKNETEGGSGQAPSETMMNGNRERMMSGMNLDKVAERLGIDSHDVEDAFNQAQEELFNSDSFNKREGLPSDGTLPEGFPEEKPEEISPQRNFKLPESFIARMAEILNIDQQTLNNAFTHSRSTDSE